MESRMPSIVDLSAELAKLTMFQRTPQSTRRRQREASHDWLPTATASFWPSAQVFCASRRNDRCHSAGCMAPRFSAEGKTEMTATPFPGDHIERDVDDPRSIDGKLAGAIAVTPSIIDLTAELAKLTTFRGLTPRSTIADRKGSAARLASYRDGALTATKFAGKGHWESHLAGDELIHVLDGTATLEIACNDGPPKSFALRAGMIAVNPQGTWHRFHSSEGVTLMTATPSPSEVIEFDVDDPRRVERKPA